MKKLKYLILSTIVIFTIIVIIVNASLSINFTERDENLGVKVINNVEYDYFYPLIPINYSTILSKGKLPELNTENQRQNWSNNLKKLGKKLETELFLNYIYPNGKVITYGENSDGYFVVVFYKNLTIEKLLMDEIYTFIDKNAKEMGIQEVPVEFGHGGIPMAVDDGRTEGEQKADEEYGNSKRATYTPEVIATYGKLPELKTEDQRFSWFYRDQRVIIEGLRNKTIQYFIPKGPLVAFGTDMDGYFVATVYKNITVERKILDEIYGLIDEEAKKSGVSDVPVKFILGDFARPDIQDAESSNKSAPSSGLPSILVTLFIGWLFIRQR